MCPGLRGGRQCGCVGGGKRFGLTGACRVPEMRQGRHTGRAVTGSVWQRLGSGSSGEPPKKVLEQKSDLDRFAV